MTMSIDLDKHGTVDTSKCLRGMNKQLLELTKFIIVELIVILFSKL